MSEIETRLCKLSDTNATVADPDEDIRGRKVVDTEGQEIGTVEDLLIDGVGRKVRLFVVGGGGFLGIGKTETFIPVDAISEINDDVVTIVHRGEQVAEAASHYDPDLSTADDAYLADVYGYYGYMPFWLPGYVYPPFPRYQERRVR